MRYKDLFIDLDDTLYDTHGNSMIALKKLFDERHWEKIMPSYEAFRDAYFATNVDVWAKYAHGEIDRDTWVCLNLNLIESHGILFGYRMKPSLFHLSSLTLCLFFEKKTNIPPPRGARPISSRTILESPLMPLRISVSCLGQKSYWIISRVRATSCISAATVFMRCSTEN